MDAGDFRAVAVIVNGKLVEIITDRDIHKHYRDPESTKISGVMSENPICISPDDSVNQAVRMLLSYKLGGLPVLREDKLVGIITNHRHFKAVLCFSELD